MIRMSRVCDDCEFYWRCYKRKGNGFPDGKTPEGCSEYAHMESLKFDAWLEKVAEAREMDEQYDDTEEDNE